MSSGAVLINHALISQRFHPFYQAVLDYADSQGWCKPSARVQRLQNDYVIRRVASGQWAVDDLLYVFAVDSCDINFTRINWHNPGTFTLTIGGVVTFISNSCVTSGGAGSLDTGFVPTVNGVNWIGATGSGYEVSIRNATTATMYEVGNAGNTSNLQFNPSGATNNTSISLCSGVVNVSNPLIDGFWMCGRNAASRACYRNGSLITNLAVAGANVATSIVLLRQLGVSSTRGIRMFSAGGNYLPYAVSGPISWDTYFNAL